MSNQRFTVDAVPTPNLDFSGAFERDLQYYVQNGNHMPPLGRSALKQVEEQLNTYLKYINESFIFKGFTGNSDSGSSTKAMTASNTSPELWIVGDDVTICNFTIQHGDNAHILTMFTIAGEGLPTSSSPMYVKVRILEDNSQVALFQETVDGPFTMSVPFLLANRKAGVSQIQIKAQVVNGEVYVPTNGSFGQALCVV